jgi:hypothetical protein
MVGSGTFFNVNPGAAAVFTSAFTPVVLHANVGICTDAAIAVRRAHESSHCASFVAIHLTQVGLHRSDANTQ